MTADEARKIAAYARESNITDTEKAAMNKVLSNISNAASKGDDKLEVHVPKECDNAIRLRLRALGYKAEWGQMTANITFIKVSFE